LNREDAKSAKEKETGIEAVATIIVDSAIKVHRALGPGLLESAYQTCLAYELRSCGLDVKCEVPLPVRYGELRVDAGYRIDMLIDDCVVIENKVVERILPIHSAQLLTYLKLSDKKLGFLLNWHVRLMKYGIKRFVNEL
jgi:GxxExxY protein